MKAFVAFRGDAAVFYKALRQSKKKEDLQLLRSIEHKIELLRTNAFYGDHIQKNKIPHSYEVQNLWRIELVHFWRMLYTIKGDEVEIICFIIDILDHPAYDKKFGYSR